MLKIKLPLLFISLFLLNGCATIDAPQVNFISSEKYKGYKPIDPLAVPKVKKYNASGNNEIDVFWESITDKKVKLNLLPIQSSEVSIEQKSSDGKVRYLLASVSRETGQYKVVMDYMKYRVQAIFDNTGKFIGNGRVGVGLRIKAKITTTKKNINLGGILSLGVEADKGNLSGGLAVDVIGIDSEGVTNLIPMTSEIDQTAIQSVLQALASVKAKMWGEGTKITPHLVAITESEPNKDTEIRNKTIQNNKTPI